jgi:phage tail-like protein
MSSALRFRNPPPGPPNDPTWKLLDGKDGWPISSASSGIAVSPTDCALVLESLPGGALALADPSGRFGDLVPPPNIVLCTDGTVFLLDRARGVLRRFDDCACTFVDVPCTGGIGAGARQLAAPMALSAHGPNLLVLDAGISGGPLGRVLVFSRHGFALRAIWTPPKNAVPLAWQPSAMAVDPQGRALVADTANGAIHIFDRAGRWRGAWPGFGAVSAIAVDRFGRIYTIIPGATEVRISGADGRQVPTATEIDAVRHCFAPLPDFASDSSGRINLAGRCAGAGWFDAAGQPSNDQTAQPPAFAASGTWLSTPVDSGIGRCIWHRVIADAHLPPHTTISILTYTAEVAQPIELVAALPAASWTAVPLTGRREALILSPPGRFLWLTVALTGDQQSTPRLHRLRIEFPRVSLRRYLPRAFGPDPVSADFADRLLAIFDEGFRSVERKIDQQADWFDPRSASDKSLAAGTPDMLTWLASWIGVTFDRAWPVARRRGFLMQAAKLYSWRGTLPGLRQALLLYLGLDGVRLPCHPAGCAPACAPPPRAWQPPPLVLEHWKIRRWLYLGAGRLGDAAVLWGEAIIGRSQLGNNAQLGVTRLDTTLAAVTDPFNADANAFTVFAPGSLARSARERASIQRMLAGETPAWAKATLRFVQPRMRVGIQACIGFDSVVGSWPEGVRLNEAQLGRATVLGRPANVDQGPRVGSSRIGTGMRIA